METYVMTLNRHLKIAKAVCDSVNIPYGNIADIKVNTRAKSFWGRCHYNTATRDYTIEISDRLLQPGVSNLALMNTLLHEILHTCNNCMNHGKLWKAYASRLNAIGYNIKRCTSASEKNIASIKPEFKYAVTCRNCGTTCHYQRKGTVIKLIENNPTKHGCRCGKCRSRNLELKYL